ncbi:MAG TPA: TRAP transporter small permease subunit [Ramlibacter sp.]|nr:TRAP transporter small permease subunit [Ramlibacter sp.]
MQSDTEPNTASGRLTRRVEQLLGLLFAVVVVLNFASAALRYSVGRAVLGADEVQVYLMIWLVFPAAALVGLRGAHLRMDLLVQRLGPAAARWHHAAEGLLTLVLCGTMAWVSFGFVRQMMEMGQRSDGAGIPMWMVHAAPCAGFLGLAAAAAWSLLRLWRDAANDKAGPEADPLGETS